MTDKWFITGIAALLSTATLAAGQTPGTAAAGTSQRPTATAAHPMTTLVGCLYREAQVPGRTPNIVERAGVLEDYILADARMPSPEATSRATPGAIGTAGVAPATGKMYKVEGTPDEHLSSLVGKRVEVMGRLDPEGGPGATPGGPRPDRSLGPDEISLPEIEATSIKEVAGTCPATPGPAQ